MGLLDFFKHSPTLLDVKKDWAYEHYPRLSKSGMKSYEESFKYLSELYDTPINKIKHKDWQHMIHVLHDKGLHYASQKKLKNTIGQICKFAIKNEIATTNYAPMLELDKRFPVNPREPFSEEEILKLWKKVNKIQHVDKILMLIYSGVRIGEFLRINVKEDLFLDKHYFIVRKSKTLAGQNRPVPIHRFVEPFFRKYAEEKNKFLIFDKGK